MGGFEEAPEPLLLAPPSREAASALSLARARRRRRRAVSRENIRRVSAQRTPRTAQLLAELWDSGAEDSRRLAARYRAVLETTHDPLGAEEIPRDAAALEELHLSLAMRCTRKQAASTIRDAHRIGTLLPLSLDRLGSGEFPAPWFERLLERTRNLEDDALQELDLALSRSDMSVPPEVFSRRLGHLITAAISRSRVREGTRPENRRRVVMDPVRPDGTGCLRVIGPIPEILELARRLDRSAHAVQDAQRAAFARGSALPADPGGLHEAAGSIPPLARTCYDILMSSPLETDGVEVPEPRFRMNVTVPVMTLLGESDAPGMLDGTIPLPAPMARELAGGEGTWYRILTDATTGRYLPVPADRYRPTGEQLAHLLLRHPTCTVPGCARPSSLRSEADHLEEFDHADPAAGGATDVSNLHQLCREHHRLKTLGLIDPVRDDEAGCTWWDASGVLMSMQEDACEFATEQVVAEMTAAWEQFEASRRLREETAERRHRRVEHGPSLGGGAAAGDDAAGRKVSGDGVLPPPGTPPPAGPPPDELSPGDQPPGGPPPDEFPPGVPPPF